MARRFGGKFSPDGSESQSGANAPEKPARGAFEGARVDPAGVRANLLALPVIPLIFMSFWQGPVGLALAGIATGFLLLAVWLLREGLRAEAAYEARKVARRPAFPRKMAASLLTGIGVAIATFKTDLMVGGLQGLSALVAPLLYGGIATVLHGVAFGIDPLKDKGMQGIDSFQQNRVARAVAEGEAYLSAMRDAIKRANDRQVEARVARFQATVREMFRTVEQDPRDLTAARKYLTVYLLGARDATVKFADIYARNSDQGARTDYLALLDDLEQNFTARTARMLLDDRSDLTIEIEVLRERLQREGVNPG
jgi:5-bromo-4-chloroindolyl phosphate hydrolysis protein